MQNCQFSFFRKFLDKLDKYNKKKPFSEEIANLSKAENFLVEELEKCGHDYLKQAFTFKLEVYLYYFKFFKLLIYHITESARPPRSSRAQIRNEFY